MTTTLLPQISLLFCQSGYRSYYETETVLVELQARDEIRHPHQLLDLVTTFNTFDYEAVTFLQRATKKNEWHCFGASRLHPS